MNEEIKFTEEEQDKQTAQRIREMMEEDPVKLMSYMVLIAGKEVVATNAAYLSMKVDATFDGQRYEVTSKTTVKKIRHRGATGKRN